MTTLSDIDNATVKRVARAIALNESGVTARGNCELNWPRDWSSSEQTVFRNQAQLAIEAHKAALADAGLVIVPREPTNKMREAGFKRLIDRKTNAYGIWQAMIKALDDG